LRYSGIYLKAALQNMRWLRCSDNYIAFVLRYITTLLSTYEICYQIRAENEKFNTKKIS